MLKNRIWQMLNNRVSNEHEFDVITIVPNVFVRSVSGVLDTLTSNSLMGNTDVSGLSCSVDTSVLAVLQSRLVEVCESWSGHRTIKKSCLESKYGQFEIPAFFSKRLATKMQMTLFIFQCCNELPRHL